MITNHLYGIMRLLSITICLLLLSACSHFKSFTSPNDTDLQTPEAASGINPSIQKSEQTEQTEQTTQQNKSDKEAAYQEKQIQAVQKHENKLAANTEPTQESLKNIESPAINSIDPDNQVEPVLIENTLTSDLQEQDGIIEVLNFPFDPIENELTDLPNKGTDFSTYGFYTPEDELEKLINNELQSLREKKEYTQDPDLLLRIRTNFKLDLEIDNKRITNQLNWYIRNPNYLTRTFNRASRYLHHVVNEVKKRDLPMELALLPFVESAYNPFAYSHGRASGLWQFIPGTGKIYGLEQDWWYDGRRDVLASTEAALNYLTYLNSIFDGNWLHALAAYNSGSGRVRSAIRKNEKRNKATDFWSLDLPKETRAYVPKLIALSKIVEKPEKFSLSLPYIADTAYFAKVDIGAQIDLAQAAALAEIDISEIYQLNPGFNQWASSPLGPHRLLVPIEKAKTFTENLASFPPDKRIHWQRYSVRSGDSLIKIAKKFNTTPMLIKEINHLKSNTIRTKQKLLIPTASKGASYYDLSQENRLVKKQAQIQSNKQTDKINYRVKSGDTFWDLARAHKVGVRELARWNGMAPTDPIKPGQNLIIWSKNNTDSAIQPALNSIYKKREMIQKVGYFVRRGDSLARIASKFKVSINDLVTWNKLDRKKYLKPGQKLTIFVDITNG